MVSIRTALLLTIAMGGVIFFCRVFPFLFFRGDQKENNALRPFLDFVEKIAPPVAMTVLAFNAISSQLKEAALGNAPPEYVPLLTASLFTVLFHLWKRNALISIFGGTIIYMAIERFLERL